MHIIAAARQLPPMRGIRTALPEIGEAFRTNALLRYQALAESLIPRSPRLAGPLNSVPEAIKTNDIYELYSVFLLLAAGEALAQAAGALERIKRTCPL